MEVCNIASSPIYLPYPTLVGLTMGLERSYGKQEAARVADDVAKERIGEKEERRTPVEKSSRCHV